MGGGDSDKSSLVPPDTWGNVREKRIGQASAPRPTPRLPGADGEAGKGPTRPRPGPGLTGSRLPAGHAAPSRIVWEHTRGRYSCMQCAFSTASRPAMTLHLEDHRPGGPAAPAPGQPRPDAPAGKAGGSARVGRAGGPEARSGAEAQASPPLPHPDPAPLAPKVSPLLSEGECPVFSPL